MLRRDSAWATRVRDNPAVVDDTSVGWQDRLILSVLSREQAEAYYQGTRAEDILLDDGQTLAEYLEARLNPGGILCKDGRQDFQRHIPAKLGARARYTSAMPLSPSLSVT